MKTIWKPVACALLLVLAGGAGCSALFSYPSSIGPTDGATDGDGVSPKCGNGRVDGGEKCDDGNKNNGDGCENDCTWTCDTPGDCDDGNRCNGTHTCDMTTHACKEIDGPQADGAPCPPDEPRHVCLAQECVESRCGDGFTDRGAYPPEECDDGANGNPDDGCRDDCTAVCTPENQADTCVDGNPCTQDLCGEDHRCAHPAVTESDKYPCRAAAGECDVEERCNAGDSKCPPDGYREVGQPCVTGEPCRANDRCDGMGGCVDGMIDRDRDRFETADCGGLDCDDLNPGVGPGAAESCDDNIDNDCDGLVNERCGGYAMGCQWTPPDQVTAVNSLGMVNRRPSISADGRKLYMTRGDPNNQMTRDIYACIYVPGAEGWACGAVDYLDDPGVREANPAISLDGTKLFYAGDNGDIYWVNDLATGARETLCESPHQIGCGDSADWPAPAPALDKLFFTALDTSVCPKWQLYSSSWDPTNLRWMAKERVSISGVYSCSREFFSPFVSANGQFLFLTEVGGGISSARNDGGSWRPLTSWTVFSMEGTIPYMGSTTPDGRYLFFSGNNTAVGDERVYVARCAEDVIIDDVFGDYHLAEPFDATTWSSFSYGPDSAETFAVQWRSILYVRAEGVDAGVSNEGGVFSPGRLSWGGGAIGVQVRVNAGPPGSTATGRSSIVALASDITSGTFLFRDARTHAAGARGRQQVLALLVGNGHADEGGTSGSGAVSICHRAASTPSGWTSCMPIGGAGAGPRDVWIEVSPELVKVVVKNGDGEVVAYTTMANPLTVATGYLHLATWSDETSVRSESWFDDVLVYARESQADCTDGTVRGCRFPSDVTQHGVLVCSGGSYASCATDPP